jgi:hypothetical protein
MAPAFGLGPILWHFAVAKTMPAPTGARSSNDQEAIKERSNFMTFDGEIDDTALTFRGPPGVMPR